MNFEIKCSRCATPVGQGTVDGDAEPPAGTLPPTFCLACVNEVLGGEPLTAKNAYLLLREG